VHHQAEHDEDAQSILLCPDADFISQVEKSIAKLLPTNADLPKNSTLGSGDIYIARANNFIYFWYGFCAISKGCYCLCT
jgi:histidinol dehydrogenase